MVGTAAAQGLARDSVDVIETNIDDMSPPHYEYLMERLFNAGALDVYLTPVYMKKTRPAVLLTALSRAESRDSIVRIILEETTTSGLRSYRAERQKLSRSVKTVRTKYGPIRVKINAGAGLKTVSPEYEDCKTAAKKAKAPLKEVMEAARNIIER
jgi:uncharacterized protein (DUF111 family)